MRCGVPTRGLQQLFQSGGDLSLLFRGFQLPDLQLPTFMFRSSKFRNTFPASSVKTLTFELSIGKIIGECLIYEQDL